MIILITGGTSGIGEDFKTYNINADIVAGKIAKILGTVLAVGGLVTVFWDDIKKAFMDFVSKIYDTIKEQFKEWLMVAQASLQLRV